MVKKLLICLGVLGIVLALGTPALAAEETGSIRACLTNGEMVVPDGSVTLHLVGLPRGEDFQVRESFGGGLIRKDDALSPVLARWLAGLAEEGGRTLALDQEGSAEFEDLPRGLYLLVQEEPSTGYQLMEPMLVMLPCEYQWYIQAFPIVEEVLSSPPATGQPLTPYWGTLGMALSGSGLLLCTRRRRRKT